MELRRNAAAHGRAQLRLERPMTLEIVRNHRACANWITIDTCTNTKGSHLNAQEGKKCWDAVGCCHQRCSSNAVRSDAASVRVGKDSASLRGLKKTPALLQDVPSSFGSPHNNNLHEKQSHTLGHSQM